jgi:hypothetical protein
MGLNGAARGSQKGQLQNCSLYCKLSSLAGSLQAHLYVVFKCQYASTPIQIGFLASKNPRCIITSLPPSPFDPSRCTSWRAVPPT